MHGTGTTHCLPIVALFPIRSQSEIFTQHGEKEKEKKARLGAMKGTRAYGQLLAATAAVVVGLFDTALAQTHQRLGTCFSLGCMLPPDQQDFLPGQEFDIRVEVHAPVNGSEAFNDGVPDEEFTVTIAKSSSSSSSSNGTASSLADFFGLEQEPEVEKWSFSWYEDLFAQEAGNQTVVNVASKMYRRVALYEPGEYTVTLSYYGGETTVASWTVRPLAEEKRAKNVILFIGKFSLRSNSCSH